jgi:hypothetical protein
MHHRDATQNTCSWISVSADPLQLKSTRVNDHRLKERGVTNDPKRNTVAQGNLTPTNSISDVTL